MKSVQRIIVLVLAISLIASICAIPAGAETVFEQDGFYYSRSSNKTADLYGRSSTDADLVIPKDFSEYYVTNIVDSAFEEDQNIETLTFGDAMLLERIGFYAFKNCISLSGQVTFGGRINTIGTSAFEDCHSLETVVFNAYVKNIPDQCFYNCYALSTVVMNDRIESIGKFAFANCALLTEITIPDSVTSIDATAFNGCDDLVIYCNTDSYAHQFAEVNGIDYVLLDAPIPVTFILGDSDGDGNVTIFDVTLIQRLLGYMAYDNDGMITLRSLVDDEDTLNITHVTKIQRYLAFFEIEEPIGTEVTRWV